MKNIISVYRLKQLKKKINASDYSLKRLNDMNREIQYWIVSMQESNTRVGREYCYAMVEMYLKRYKFYLNK